MIRDSKENLWRLGVFQGYVLNPIDAGLTADGTPYVRVRASDYKPSAINLKNKGYNLLYLGVIEWKRVFEVAISLYNFEEKINGILSTMISKEKPIIPTITDVFPPAYLYENEAYEMFGIFFQGHPGLRRLFTEEELGHPFRKNHLLPQTPVGGWRPIE